MFSKIFLLSLIAAAAATDLDNYTFEQFVTEFKLDFKPAEVENRRSVFYKELNRVRDHNSKGLSWKEGVNKFSAFTPEEMKAYQGRTKNVLATKLKTPPSDFVLKPLSELPQSVDWRTKGVVTAVKDQGHCGSCWAFAAAAVIESHVAVNSGLLFDLSVQQLAMCTPNPNKCGGTGGCHGATAEIAMDFLATQPGIYQEYQYSYASYYGDEPACAIPTGNPVAAIDGYVQLPSNNYTALMNAVATLGPVSVSVDASTFKAYKSGIFDGCNQEQPDINHAVILVGYGTEDGKDYWIVRNSWSPTYGEAGYLRVLRTKDEEGRCGIDITPEHGSACEGETDPIKVCGTCGILYESAYPTGARRL